MKRATYLVAGLVGLTTAVMPIPAPASDGAEPRFAMGVARLFTNDTIGDGRDRWRSGAYTVSLFRGRGWDGTLPWAPGDILEYRLRTEVIAPSSLQRPPADDRRYAGILALGLHSHFQFGGAEMRLGGDLVMVGPQTGVGAFQREFHEIFGFARPRVLGNQLPNATYPTISAELGQNLSLGPATRLRPFVELQAGVEDFARAGFDLTYGTGLDGALMTRDPVTGHRMQGVSGTDQAGFTFTLGADIAHVLDSELLPEGGAAPLKQDRARARAGLNWRGERSEVFYGLTWHGREFTTQNDDQVTGSLRLQLRF